MESDPEPDPYSLPKLPLFSVFPNPPEPSGISTPPLQTAASVPFRWEEQPGKPRPCTDVIVSSKIPLNRRLDLPPRLAMMELQSNVPLKVKGSNPAVNNLNEFDSNPAGDRLIGFSTNPAADRLNGFSSNPAVDRLNGFSTNPAADRLNGFSSNPAADRLNGFSTNPAADRLNEFSSKSAADRLSGFSTNPMMCRLDGFKSRLDFVYKKKSSPTTVFDGPGSGDVGPKSLFSSFSFRFPKDRRHRRQGSFDSNFSGGWSPVGCPNGSDYGGGGRLFGSFRLRRNASVSKVSSRSKFLTKIYEGFKQVVPWRKKPEMEGFTH